MYNGKILFFMMSVSLKLNPLITGMSEDQMAIDLIRNISLKMCYTEVSPSQNEGTDFKLPNSGTASHFQPNCFNPTFILLLIRDVISLFDWSLII